MAMKIIKEGTVPDVEATESLSSYLQLVRQSIDDETTAIKLYDKMLGMSDLPASVRKVIEEIRDDEKDHLVIFTSLLEDAVGEELDGYGDE